MTETAIKVFTAFEGHRLIIRASLPEVAHAVKAVSDAGSSEPLLVFDDATGRSVDIDLRGNTEDVRERLSQASQTFIGRFRPPVSQPGQADDTIDAEPRGRGRPKLGVVAREVTLLPRHWEWLGAQPGGASAVLRRLVDNAKRTELPKAKQRIAQEAAYQFMTAIAGDLLATRRPFARYSLVIFPDWLSRWKPGRPISVSTYCPSRRPSVYRKRQPAENASTPQYT